MPGFMNCLRLASTSSADGPEYFCGVCFVGGNGMSFIKFNSKFRREFAQYKINHERQGKANEPGVIEQAHQSRWHARGIKLGNRHEKSRQARQHAPQKRNDRHEAESVLVTVFAV